MHSRADAAPSLVYLADLPGPGQTASLSDDERHYLIRVCRVRDGEQVQATDGRGSLATLRIARTERGWTAMVESLEHRERERRAAVWCGAPEGDRADWLVEKLAELGVETFQPVDSERSKWKAGASRTDRWRRIAVAALRQSRRRHLLQVLDPRPLHALLDEAAPAEKWIADPAGAPAESPRPGAGLTIGVVGPAVGFTDRERERMAGSGFAPIRLSDGRLRTETAALAWAAWWSLGA